MDTVYYSDKSANNQFLYEAAEVLKDGGLVVFPTETVYGVAARADSKGINAINELKQRDESKFYTLHLPSVESISSYIPKIDLRAEKLIKNFLPGAITIVFKLTDEDIAYQKKKLGNKWSGIYRGNSLGVRCPDNDITSKILEYANVPVVASSANINGQPAATDFEQAKDYFGGKVDVMIDGGACPEAVGSTVVRIGSKGIDILREGAIPGDDIADIAKVNLLFVCSSNTCRSPIAAQICKKVLSQRIGCDIERLEMFGYKVFSAGVMAPINKPISSDIVDICSNLGLEVSNHTSSGLAQSDIFCSDFIFVMEEDHRKRIVDFYPQLADKCLLVAGDYDICNPGDGKMEVYSKFTAILEDAIIERINELSI